MSPSLLAVLLPLGLAGPIDDPIVLEYSGNLVAKPRGEEPVAVKRFTLTALVTQRDGRPSVLHVVDETGGGGWAWPERFALTTIGEDAALAGPVPALLHDYNETKSPIDLPLPIFAHARRVQPGGSWVDGKLSYEVDPAGRAIEIGGRRTTRVDVSTNFGRQSQLWLEDGTLVVKAVRKLFLGRGDEFELTMELKSAEKVAAGDVEPLEGLAESLLALRETTGRDERETKPEIGTAKLEKLATALDGLDARAEGTPFEGLVADITKDVAAQRKRTVDAAALASRYVGKPAPEFALLGTDGKPIAPEEGKPLLLHFWGYRGDALEEPYGQVGYISFLQGKREKIGLRIVGVAVNKGAADPAQRAAVRRSVNKLREFMRLDYPIAVDDGTVLKAFGDPRRIGATLPLWVLVDHDGTISAYHTGYYEADPNKGLVELDAAVVKALRRMRGRE